MDNINNIYKFDSAHDSNTHSRLYELLCEWYITISYCMYKFYQRYVEYVKPIFSTKYFICNYIN